MRIPDSSTASTTASHSYELETLHNRKSMPAVVANAKIDMMLGSAVQGMLSDPVLRRQSVPARLPPTSSNELLSTSPSRTSSPTPTNLSPLKFDSTQRAADDSDSGDERVSATQVLFGDIDLTCCGALATLLDQQAATCFFGVLTYLNARDLCSLEATCKTMQTVMSTDSAMRVWKLLCSRHWFEESIYSVMNVCRIVRW